MSDASAGLSEEELKALSKDITDAKSALKIDALEKAKAQGKEEALKEAELQRKFDEQAAANKQLQEEIKKQKEDAAKQLTDLQKKVDEMVTSKQVTKPSDPFTEPPSSDGKRRINVDTLTPEQIRELEENSARQFWGNEAYELMKRENTV